jgi:uncharacterized protein YbjT (DUF2867 family)
MYVITGATGNIGSKIVKRLLDEGQAVRMIARNAEKMKPFENQGGEAFPGSAEDAEFLTKAFTGAKAVFTMEPPDVTADDPREFINDMGEKIARAIQDAGVKYVVNLSTVGAHLPDSSGFISGLHDQENRLNQIEGINVLHLRPAYFMENLFDSMGMIKEHGMIGWTIKSDLKIPMIATEDIANYAADRLMDLDFKGSEVKYLLGERDVSYNEVAQIIGSKIGLPDLKYQEMPKDTVRDAMRQWGLNERTTEAFITMMDDINTGRIYEDSKRTEETTTPTSLERFSEKFAEVYKQS